MATSKLRPYWLVFLRDLKTFFTVCRKCHRLGAYPCSICACINLCTDCQNDESVKLCKKLESM
jgi:hypothetical protein